VRYWYDDTERADRRARVVASLLLILAVVCLTAAWQLHERTEQHLAAVRGDNPNDLMLVPVLSSSPEPAQPSSGPPPSTRPDLSITPTHLYVPAIHVDTTVAAKPTQRTKDPFVKQVVASFGVPDDMYTTTWWSSGPKPGSGAMAVILGHTQVGGYGVFNHLGSLHRGDTVMLTGSGEPLRFAVVQVRTGISKTDPYALRKALAAHPADAALALITCSGTFDTNYDQSTENTVAFAELRS
jgi:LPXTG-site transpeptidase (sortase) family protein